MRAEGAVGGDAHAAARDAAVPSADRGGGGEGAGQAGIVAEHAHPERQGLVSRRPRQLVDEAFGEEAGVAVRARAPEAELEAELDRHMVHRDVGDPIGRHRAGDGPGLGAEEAAGGASRRATASAASGAAIRACQAAMAPCCIQAVIRAAAGGRKASRWISWMRGQVSWTGRSSFSAKTAACSIASLSSLRP